MAWGDKTWRLKVERVAEHLRKEIPAPAPPPVRKQKTWATLRHEDKLIDKDGVLWLVTDPTNLGVTLTSQYGDTSTLTDRDWRNDYTKQRKAKT